MKIQLLSDLHLETEAFDPEPAPGAELLVLAGDIDATWAGYQRFAGWPVPVIVVAGNHEFDFRELDSAWPALRDACARLGFSLLQRESTVITAADGRRVRFAGATRWSDFALFGAAGRERAERAAGYFLRLMSATRAGRPFDAAAVRTEGLASRPSCRARGRPTGMPPWWSPTSAPACAAPTRATAASPVPRASATPTTTCCPRPTSGCTATCTAGTTTSSTARGAGRRAWPATRAASSTRARPKATTR